MIQQSVDALATRRGDAPPAVQAEPAAEEVEGRPEPVRIPAGPSLPRAAAGERILVVESEPGQAWFYCRMLELLGYRVEQAGNGQRALELARDRDQRFDLVICDVSLALPSSEELTLGLLELRPGLPILLCGKDESRMNDMHARMLGARAFRLKPFLLTDLAYWVRWLMDEQGWPAPAIPGKTPHRRGAAPQ